MNLLTVIRRLTDVYNKNPNSNIGKALLLLTEQMNRIEAEAEKVELWRSIDNAEGTTLDYIGLERGQARGQASDTVMRALIKTRIAQNNSDGTVPFLKNFISLLLKIPLSQIVITSLADTGKSATLHVNVPGNSIAPTGLSLKQLGQILNAVAASGVKIETLAAGTFSFSDSYTESNYNHPHGFSDDEMTVGGTLGQVYDPAIDIVLPI